MRIDIWSDVVCPWCWIGKHRLRAALAQAGIAGRDAEVHWHAFQLDPEAGDAPVPLREAYARKFGGPGRTEQILRQTQDTGRAEGLPFDFDRGQVRVSTFKAHRLLWLAAREGDADAVGEALFRAHFAEGRNLAELQTLVDAGAAGGLPEVRVRALFAGDEGSAEVRAQIAQARQLGIRAVPSFLIDGRVLVQGAQSPEAFLQAFAQAGASNVQATPADDACGPEGCVA